MEVVLLEDVKALGKKGQIVKVSDGYGRNFILTKKLGIEATPKNLNDLKLQKANEAKIAAEHLAAAKDLAKHLEDKSPCPSRQARAEKHSALFLPRRLQRRSKIS